MNTFGQKRPASPDDAVRKKRGRPKKKPEYNKEESIQKLLQKAVELFEEPFDDRVYRTEEAPSLRDVARKMNTSELRVRKLLVTADYYSTKTGREILLMHDNGLSNKQIAEKTKLALSSVCGYLPYSKSAYNMDTRSLYADRCLLFRRRKNACEQLQQHLEMPDAEEYLWKALEAFEQYPFSVSKGHTIKYALSDEAIVFTESGNKLPKETVLEAFRNDEFFIDNQDDSLTSGAGYLKTIFLRIGAWKENKKNAEMHEKQNG